MSVQKPVARIKRPHPKVSTGCDNCKRRRIKCDETKPSCRQCRKNGSVCAGYHPPRARIFQPFNDSSPALQNAPVHQSNAISRPQQSDLVPTTALTESPDLRMIWQKALLDVFLTQWLPSNLAREQAVGKDNAHVVSMSAWPAVAWKLGRESDDSILVHSLLCLVLCLLGSQTGRPTLIDEAAQHYLKVLSAFQTQIHHLGRSGYEPYRDKEIASLTAAGYCCAQIEYILGSWGNADKHLNGIATIFQACGPACLEAEDTLRIFLDHCLLWISCAVVHRRDTIYSRAQWHLDWTTTATSCHSCRSILELLAISSRLPGLLNRYHIATTQPSSSSDMMKYMFQFSNIVAAIETISISAEMSQSRKDLSSGWSEVENSHSSHHVLGDAIIVGYSSAFALHALSAMYCITNTLDRANPEIAHGNSAFKQNEVQARCEMHATKVCRLVDHFLEEGIGAMMANPCLFFVDSAWSAYEAIGRTSGQGSASIRAWFNQVGNTMAKRGFQPLREFWATT